MRKERKRRFLLNGEQLRIETALGTIDIDIARDGRGIQISVEQYHGVDIQLKNGLWLHIRHPYKSLIKWIKEWSIDRPPWRLYLKFKENQ